MPSNQYLTITPNSVEIDEYSVFNVTFTIAYTPPEGVTDTYDYVLHFVTIDSSIPAWIDITYTKLSPLSFSLAGKFDDVFGKTLKYINEDLTYGEVNRFANLPASYASLYQYIPSATLQIPFTMNVVMRPNNIPIDQILLTDFHRYPLMFMVRNNWQTANQYFVEAVHNGNWVKGIQ